MTRPIPDLPPWIHEGAQVVLYRHHFSGGSVRFTTVERLTATQIVLADGSRYRRDTLREVGRHYEGPQLLAADDPKVVETIAANQLRDALHAVKAAAEKVRTDHDAETAATRLRDLAEAVAAAQTLLAHVYVGRAARVTDKKD